MTDIAERLHTIRDHLRTGRFGQREVWEEWLAEAAAEVERLHKIELQFIALQEERVSWFADNERLRAALEEILAIWAKGRSVQIGPIARRALEPKP